MPAEGLILGDNVPRKDCELCGLMVPYVGFEGKWAYDCPRCGKFESDHMEMLATPNPMLSAATRQSWEAGVALRLTDLEIRNQRNKTKSTVAECATKCLNYLARRSKRPGMVVPLDAELDYPIADAVSGNELAYYILFLAEQGLIRANTDPDGMWQCTVKVAGWEAVNPGPQPGGIPGRCFVVMSFSEALDEAYRVGIKPAIEECGYEAVCMKEVSTNKGITDRILAEVRQAQFVVADFTEHRAGCYYEAGFAQGLGREVIWSCRESHFKELHFDTRHLGHIKWHEPADLRQQLTYAIIANIGKFQRS